MYRRRTIIIMGVSGSGKSVVGRAAAHELGWEFCEGDDHHPARNVAKMSSGVPLTSEDREPWLVNLLEVMNGYEDQGKSLVLACSALEADFRDRLLSRNDVDLVYLTGDRNVIARRIEARRGHFMSHDMLDSQLKALEEPDAAVVIDVSQDVDAIVALVVKAFGPE